MTFTSISRRHLLARMSMAAAAPVALGFGMAPTARADDAAPTPPDLAVYGKLPLIQNVALSPDGQRVALVMDKNGERGIYDIDLATGKAAAAIIATDKVRQLMWADNDHVLAITSSTTHDVGDVFEDWFGLIFDIPAGKRMQMYQFVAGVNQANVGGDFYRIKTKGKYYVTASAWKAPDGMNMTNSDGNAGTLSSVYDRCLFAFDPSSSASHKIDEDARVIQDWVLNPDGTVLARSEFDDDTKQWTLRYNGDKGWKAIWQVKAPLDLPVLAGMGRDGQSVLVHLHSGDSADNYVEISPEGTMSEPLKVNGSNHYPIFSNTTFRLVGFGCDEGVTQYVFYDPVYQKLPALIDKAMQGMHAVISDFSEDPLRVLVFVEGEGNPGTYYLLDFTKGAYKEIGERYPDLPAEWVADKTAISYPAADGLEIPAYLSLPVDRDAKNLALVVLPHGGPQAYDDSSFDWMAQALTSRGYAVLQPNYRGSDGYGQDFIAKGYGEFGRKMQTDLSDGVRYLVKQGTVDAKKVAIAGGSYGGYAALAGVSLDPGVYNCAVALAGISDIKTFMEDRRRLADYDKDSTNYQYWVRYLGDDSAWDQISPVKHIDAITVPILLIHGKDDTVVPYGQSQEIYDALTKASKPVEMVQLSEEDHWLSREPTRVQTIEAMVAFIMKNNPPA